MKNFIFKSNADFHKILFNKLDMVLSEQRHQRMDLTVIIRMLKKMEIANNLQKQVDEYFEDDIPPATPNLPLGHPENIPEE